MTWKILFAISMGKDTQFLNTENIKICGQITKLEVIRMHYACMFFHIAEYLQKFELLISQGIEATCLWWGGRCQGFVANFIRFPAVQKFCKSVKIWERYRQFTGGNFFETQCGSRRTGNLKLSYNTTVPWHRHVYIVLEQLIQFPVVHQAVSSA